MILLAGIPSEPPLELVAGELARRSAPVVVFNQRDTLRSTIEVEIVAGRVTGTLALPGGRHRLEDFDAVYLRLMDDRLLPELRGLPPGAPEREHAAGFHDALWQWAELTPGRILNRPSAMGSNCSKPLQAQLAREAGLGVPATLITNDPDEVRAFAHRHGRLIYKSMSGVRSIVQSLEEEDFARLEQIRRFPVQFQQLVEGTDVRVHTVGDTCFATAIHSTATDYRYTDGHPAPTLEAVTLPDGLAERCRDLARSLGLHFAGIDLRLTPAGDAVCFEVNPSPGYSYYEANTGQPIAAALATFLANPN